MIVAAMLKERHRAARDSQPEALRLRIHRAISWLSRSEQEVGDPDARFLFQWIAFNAAYAREFGRDETERGRVRDFMATLVVLDGDKHLHKALFQQFSGPIRTLIDNHFSYEPFWTAMRTHDSSGRWETSFVGSRKAAFAAVMNGETVTVLGIVFDRLYVLRNQLVHGGATWNSQTNRAQIEDGAAILSAIVPLMLVVMMERPEQDYGAVLYPVV